jgi:hypothetical protein
MTIHVIVDITIAIAGRDMFNDYQDCISTCHLLGAPIRRSTSATMTILDSIVIPN